MTTKSNSFGAIFACNLLDNTIKIILQQAKQLSIENKR